MGEESSLMEDLAAAWDDAELEEAPAEEEAVEEDVPRETLELVQDEPEAPEEPEAIQEAPAEPAVEEDKAPAGLSPAARERWADTPKEIRDDIVKREADYAKGIQQYAEAAKRAQGMDRALAPFGQLMSMNGGAAQFLPSLLQTASMLQMGTPAQKAQMAANIIKQFDVDIQALDGILVGEQPQQNDVNAIVQQAVQQATAPYQQHFQQMQQQENYTSRSQVEEFAADPKNEFYQDVRMEMASIMERSNKPMTLDEAYEQACWANPQVRQVMLSRQGQQQVEERRAAASSVAGTPSGPAAPSEPGTLRETIEQAWDTIGRV